jgi:hypothetical protein
MRIAQNFSMLTLYWKYRLWNLFYMHRLKTLIRIRVLNLVDKIFWNMIVSWRRQCTLNPRPPDSSSYIEIYFVPIQCLKGSWAAVRPVPLNLFSGGTVCVWCSNLSYMSNLIVRNKTAYLTIFHTLCQVVSKLPAVKKWNSFFYLYLIKLLS